jgi:16S rRNA (cytosine967-C5)-methyltransferase
MSRRPHPIRRFTKPDGPGVGPRRAALKLLDAVVRRGEPLETALHAATQGLDNRADKALTHAIAADVLRWMVDLDALIDGATERPLPEDAKARMVLRIALTQVLRLGTPDHAAVATALPLVEGGPRKLVHGVLGTLIRGGARLPETPTLAPEVAERWTGQWGEVVTEGAARALGRRAPIDLTLADAGETGRFVEEMGGVSLMPGHVRLGHEVSVPDLPGFEEGRWWVQDIAASIPARLAGAGGERSAIDLCAAPGGKTMQLAAQGWRVTALDKSAKRLERLTANLERSGLSAEVAQGDALSWEPGEAADLILLDAPCSATGIFRRHPDVLYRAGPRQIAELAEQQAAMLARAADWVKPGGMMIYATCSLEQAEGEQRITEFLDTHREFSVSSPQPSDLPKGIAPTANGYVRTLPPALEEQGGLDGFFIARLIREG